MNNDWEWGEDELFSWHQNGAGMSKIEAAFWEFHAARPIVYDLLEDRARARFRAGDKHGSIQLLYEQIRKHLPLPLDADGLKLNNNHTAFYARLIEERNPELKNFFKKRKLKFPPTFGPENDSLPPNEHIS